MQYTRPAPIHFHGAVVRWTFENSLSVYSSSATEALRLRMAGNLIRVIVNGKPIAQTIDRRSFIPFRGWGWQRLTYLSKIPPASR